MRARDKTPRHDPDCSLGHPHPHGLFEQGCDCGLAALFACRDAVLWWAKEPGTPGGNPYTQPLVVLARWLRSIEEHDDDKEARS